MSTRNQPGAPPLSRFPAGADALRVVLSLTGLLTGLTLAAGQLVLRFVDVGDLQQVKVVVASALSAILIVIGGRSSFLLHRRMGRGFNLVAGAMLTVVTVTLVCGEFLARWFMPPWPTHALHAVDSNVARRAWAAVVEKPGAVGFNTWGQRDRERSLAPGPGVDRWVFVGDSFLEDSTDTPVSVATEDVLRAAGGAPHEVINLGVSATAPDEYFYRIRRVALPLQPSAIAVFVYAGNDIIQQRTMRSFHGLLAPFPRDSLFHHVGLHGLNFFSTQFRRPIIEAWGKAGDLGRIEVDVRARVNAMRTRDDWYGYLRERASWREESQRRHLEEHLARVDTLPIMDIMQHPDSDLFRSYYIGFAERALLEALPQGIEDPSYTVMWLKQALRVCQAADVQFHVVLVPEGATVDDRMHEQWLPLGDLRPYMAPRVLGIAALGRQMREAGAHVVDLYPVLQGTRGTYLNVDGHWSPKGVALVARHLAQAMASH